MTIRTRIAGVLAATAAGVAMVGAPALAQPGLLSGNTAQAAVSAHGNR